jgi:hypothetical protein
MQDGRTDLPDLRAGGSCAQGRPSEPRRRLRRYRRWPLLLRSFPSSPSPETEHSITRPITNPQRLQSGSYVT